MAAEQKSKFPQNISDLKNIQDLSPSSDGKAQEVQEELLGEAPDADTPAPDDDPRINVSTADDVDIEPDEEEQSDELVPPIIPPEKTE